jgi:NDP-sugar pyrophosphorylase family protein
MTDSLAGMRPRTNPGGKATEAVGVDGIVGVVLAAGEGRRLRPLTLRRPKPLCPVGNVALVDLALDRVAQLGVPVAANVHHGRDQLEPHLAARADVHVSVETDRALGTAGALGHLREWIDGRHVVVVNADTWSDVALADALATWDRTRVRVAVDGDPVFGPRSRIVASFLPWSAVRHLTDTPTQLYDTTWRPAAVADELDVVGTAGAFFDCGTPRSYLAANRFVAVRAGGVVVDPSARLDATVTDSVIGARVDVAGEVRGSVVWDDADVAASESLVGAIRVSSTMTVLVR